MYHLDNIGVEEDEVLYNTMYEQEIPNYEIKGSISAHNKGVTSVKFTGCKSIIATSSLVSTII